MTFGLDTMIPLTECKHGFLYRIYSRNLKYGVFNKKVDGFIGIREKFTYRFLDTEFHWDTGVPFGTAKPQKELSAIPEDIVIAEHLETRDADTKRLVSFDKPVAAVGKGWFFEDTGEPSDKIRPQIISNDKLFEFLDAVETEYAKQNIEIRTKQENS